MTSLARLQIYQQWEREAAAYTGPDRAGACRGIDDYIWAQCLLLDRMLEAGEITMQQLVREAMNATD